MPEKPVDAPLKRTEARVKVMRLIARNEVWCVAIPTQRGTRWFPAGLVLSRNADDWLTQEPVRTLWTSRRSLADAVIGRPYRMTLTNEGVQWLHEGVRALPDEGPTPDRRVS